MCSERSGVRRRLLVPLMGALSLSIGGGCAASHPADRAVDHAPDSASELDFWQRLETQSLLSNHDALHGLLLLADGKDDRAGFAERLEEARRRGWVGAGESLAPDETAAVGLVCVALCDVLALRGGVTMRLAPRSWRYCTREVVAAGLLPDRTEYMALRGPDFLDLVGRAEDWRAAHGSKP